MPKEQDGEKFEDALARVRHCDVVELRKIMQIVILILILILKKWV